MFIGSILTADCHTSRGKLLLSPKEMLRLALLAPTRIPPRIALLFHRTKSQDAPALPGDDFDARTGIETKSIVPLYKIEGKRLFQRHRYEATHPQAFARAIEVLPIDRSQFTFIDIGCGKGRTLFLAREHGFPLAIGVELSELLVRIARENIRKLGAEEHITVHHADACEWRWPDVPTVAFLYNPFGPRILDSVLDRIEESSGRHEFFLIYHQPLHVERVSRRAWLTPYASMPLSAIFRAA